MRRAKLILLLFCLTLMNRGQAQREENLWFFGATHVVDFSGGAPVVSTNPPQSQTINIGNYTGGGIYYPDRIFGLQAGVCDGAGNLRFFVKIIPTAAYAQQYSAFPKVFDRTGYSMPNGDIKAKPQAGERIAESSLILPWPGEPDKYFLCYISASGLLYSVVDMRLNNGMGDVDTNYKDVVLCGFGTIIGAKITAVQGCDGVWLVVRSRISNRYFSYKVTRQGVDHNPVISETGSLPEVADYIERYYQGGRLTASPDGKTLAAATNKGIELYDFEKCSGKLTNPRLIDTFTFLGVCFSPDSRKLYASSHEYWPHIEGKTKPGRVYQYDLNRSTPADITAAKVLVLEYPRKACWKLLWWCYCDTNYDYLGDLKLGPDKKIYALNNMTPCTSIPVQPTVPMPYFPPPLPLATHDRDAMHVIHAPDSLGWDCRPEPHVLVLGPYSQTTGLWLSHPVILPPPDPDTFPGRLFRLAACFTDSLLLSADEDGRCHYWNDGTATRERTIDGPGIYTVSYFSDHCTFRTDTFDVVFTRSPQPGKSGYSCLYKHDGVLQVSPSGNDTTTFRYEWLSEDNIIRTAAGDSGDRMPGLYPGNYSVRITTDRGCDTVFQMEVMQLPQPKASFETDSLVCAGDPLIFINTSQTPLWRWYFGDGTMVAGNNTTTHIYREAGRYTSMLVVENIEQCTDTAVRIIDVKELSVQLNASVTVARRHEEILLKTEATVPFRVTAWLPEALFPDPEAYTQIVFADTGRRYTVIAMSEYGCIDTAEVYVDVHPQLFFPTAFTPNGDGRNDYFRPVVSGGSVTIRYFQVFDRWGNEVWSSGGDSPTTGWDGTYKDRPAEAGVYFYTIELAAHTGETIRKKGDVTLIR